MSGSFESSYWLQFQILENSSNSPFLLYRAIMPSQVVREQVKLLSLTQIIFQWLNFFILAQIFSIFHILFRKCSHDALISFKSHLYHSNHLEHYQCPMLLHRVHWCILHCPTLVYGDNIDPRCAYYTTLHHVVQICIFLFFYLKK